MGSILVLGSLNADLVLPAERMPRPGETLLGGDLRIFPGGKGANQAYAAARLGGNVAMAGRIGADPFGALLRSSLAEAGVDCSLVEDSPRPTGIAIITVSPAGENSILLSPGANHDLSTDWVRQRLAARKPGGILLCQLEIPLPATVAALELARSQGAICILDPAPAAKLDPAVLALVDILTPNQSEAALMLGLDTPPETHSDAIDACAGLARLGARQVILKMGALGCVMMGDSGPVVQPGFPVQAVDTTAAGDTFNAALAVRLQRGGRAAEALAFANAAAALSVTRAGAQASAPTLPEVQAFLNRNQLQGPNQ